MCTSCSLSLRRPAAVRRRNLCSQAKGTGWSQAINPAPQLHLPALLPRPHCLNMHLRTGSLPMLMNGSKPRSRQDTIVTRREVYRNTYGLRHRRGPSRITATATTHIQPAIKGDPGGVRRRLLLSLYSWQSSQHVYGWYVYRWPSWSGHPKHAHGACPFNHVRQVGNQDKLGQPAKPPGSKSQLSIPFRCVKLSWAKQPGHEEAAHEAGPTHAVLTPVPSSHPTPPQTAAQSGPLGGARPGGVLWGRRATHPPTHAVQWCVGQAGWHGT